MAVTSGNTDLKNKLQTQANGGKVVEKPKTVFDLMNAMKPEIARALPKHMDADRLLRIAVTAVRVNPKLQLCTQESLLAGVMTSAQLGLEPNTPLQQAFLIPYDNNVKIGNEWKKVLEVQFQLGYQGVLDLAYRTNQYKDIYAEGVFSKDVFEYRLGLNRDLIHEPCEEEDRGELTHVYAVYHTKNGGFDFKVWTVTRIRKHAKQFSKSYESKKGAWQASDASFLGMCKKTVLLDLLKYGPKSIEFAKQITTDEAVKNEISADMTEVPAINITYEMGEETPGGVEVTAFYDKIMNHVLDNELSVENFRLAVKEVMVSPLGLREEEIVPEQWKDLSNNFNRDLPKIMKRYQELKGEVNHGQLR